MTRRERRVERSKRRSRRRRASVAAVMVATGLVAAVAGSAAASSPNDADVEALARFEESAWSDPSWLSYCRRVPAEALRIDSSQWWAPAGGYQTQLRFDVPTDHPAYGAERHFYNWPYQPHHYYAEVERLCNEYHLRFVVVRSW